MKTFGWVEKLIYALDTLSPEWKDRNQSVLRSILACLEGRNE